MSTPPCIRIPATDRLFKPLFATLVAVTIQFGVNGCVNLPLLEQVKPKEKEAERVQAEPPKPVLPTAPQEVAPAKSKRWEWEGDNRKITHIWIDVDSQKARFYEGTKQVGWTYVASGLKSHPTPVGHFAVMGKEKTKESNLYGKIYNAEGQVVVSDAQRGRHPVPAGGRFAGAKMPYFLRLTGDGVGLHAGRIPRPGHPASHGCIRLPEQFAQRLFTQVPVGTPVTITGTGPDYGDYRGKLAAQGAARQEPAEGGTLSPAEVAKIQPASAPTVQTEPVKPRPAPLPPEPPRTTPTEPVKPRPTQTQSAQNPTAQPQVGQPPYTQPRVAKPQPPQNQSWKPLVTERALAVPVGVQPANQANPSSVAQPGSTQGESNPSEKLVPPKQIQAGSTQSQESVTPPQAASPPAARPEIPLAVGQTPPRQAPEAPIRDKAAPATPSAALNREQTAPSMASPGSGAAPAAPPVAEQLPAKLAPLVQPLPSATQPSEPAAARVPAENRAPPVPLGKDQTQAEPAPAGPVQAEPGETKGG
ncbi:MAG: L,D-transpeptidase family protein [Chromatiaceae bacterium]